MKNICFVVFIGMLLLCSLLPHSACAAEPAAPAAARTIQTEEVKDDNDTAAEEQKASLSDAKKSRTLTQVRLAGLAGFWLLIAIVICLIRLQVRDDEKLYDQGYYEKDLDHM
jgi:hypothetical protein